MNRGAVAVLTASAFAAGIGAARAAQPGRTGRTGREPQFENAEVKVWKSVIQPNEPLPLHRHDHSRVIVALEGGRMRILEAGGASETHDWESGKAYWLPANAPGTTHQDVNVGSTPITVMVVELQRAR